MDPKYIVFRRTTGEELAVVLPWCVTHRYIMQAVRKSGRYGGDLREATVVGAGFFYVDSEGVVVHGRSETLDVESRAEDAAVIESLLEGKGGEV